MDRISRRSLRVEQVRVGGSPLCCLQMMWCCWPPRTVTFGIRWGVLQPSVKRRWWESAPPNLRPWCSAENRWIAPSRWGQSVYPKRRSSSISGSCSRLRVRWSGRSSGGSVRLHRAPGVLQALLHYIFCCEEGAESEGKALNLPVGLRSNPHLWSRTLAHDRKNKIADTSGQNETLTWSGSSTHIN